MAKAHVLVITGLGTNCERESAHAALEAGADTARIVYFSDLLYDKVRIEDYNFLIFPGGFLDGDDLGAAQAAAVRWRHAKTENGTSLLDSLKGFISSGGLILGICNGFQLLVKLGLLPALGGRYFERQVSLGINDSARFEARWTTLKANPDSACVFTRGIDVISLPVRHGEGKIITCDDSTLDELERNNLVALRYVNPRTSEPTMEYPYNPNGSPNAIAGLTDPSGRILGLMPHPEAYNHPTNHPNWNRMEDKGKNMVTGIKLLAGGIDYLKQS